jgi:dipeptidyl aminopeptidase/acylaminoacyl peptidase
MRHSAWSRLHPLSAAGIPVFPKCGWVAPPFVEPPKNYVLVGFQIALACLVLALIPPVARAQGTRADYDRAAQLPALTRNKVFKSTVTPRWLAGNRQFWYRNDLASGAKEFVLVDAAAGERSPAFDHSRLATALAKLLKKELAADRLPFNEIRFDDQLTAVRFSADGKKWECPFANYELRELGPGQEQEESLPPLDEPRRSRRTGEETSLRFINRTKEPVQIFWLDTEGGRRQYATLQPDGEHEQHTFAGHVWLVTSADGKSVAAFEATAGGGRAIIDGRPRAPRQPRRQRQEGANSQPGSPDGKWEVTFKEHNVVLRDRQTTEEYPLSSDGTAEDAYSGAAFWSPDSHRVVVLRTLEGDHRQVHLIESSPRNQLQPKLDAYNYLKPGDRIPLSKPHLFDVAERKEIPVADDLFPNPWSIDNLRWQPDSGEFRFTYNQRGHQVLRVLGVDAEMGKARTIIDELQPTFIDYAHKQYRHDLDDTGEIIWMSERDGWNHLYLYDARTGTVKNAITHGDWVVRSVERVDPERREIWFRASGLDPEQDPYYLHDCRINFDGTNLVRLTAGDGTHSIAYSPDREFLIDTYSRVDLPPVTEVHRVSDGSLVCELERADWSPLVATGWKSPEHFVAKGRDDKTDIFGVIFRPTNFDPAQKYPVIEQIYAGPHGSFVPKGFQPYYRLQSLSELGFIIVQIDGMGTSHRSKAFQDVSCKNLGDSGFPDRIRWLRAAAAKYPELDLSRVGIYGGSAGGQSALRALLAHPDFYKAAVADCGCHDNRMDKIWWNELWMGWPIGPHYAEQSNVTNAHKLQGKLLLTVGELDHNVDPASTMQVVNALIKADKDFDLLIVPGSDHGAGESPYASRRRMDFFVRHLWGVEPRR